MLSKNSEHKEELELLEEITTLISRLDHIRTSNRLYKIYSYFMDRKEKLENMVKRSSEIDHIQTENRQDSKKIG